MDCLGPKNTAGIFKVTQPPNFCAFLTTYPTMTRSLFQGVVLWTEAFKPNSHRRCLIFVSKPNAFQTSKSQACSARRQANASKTPFVSLMSIHIQVYLCGCGSKNRYQNGTLVSRNMDQNLRNPSCLILSHTHVIKHLNSTLAKAEV